MSQVGRISGPLLTANLERNGIDLAFRNTSGSTQLLYLDVNNGKIGVNKGVAGHELDINSTIHTTNLISTNTSSIANLTISQNNITTLTGDINLSASDIINLSSLGTDNINIDDNIISSFDSNSNIDLMPSAESFALVFSNLEIYGNLHSNQNITLDGTITLGDTLSQDTVIFNTDINSDIMPDTTGTYNLGSITSKWNELYTNLVNGTSVTATSFVVDNLDYNLKLGNTFYVSVNGNDSNSGDSIFSPFETVKRALAASDASTSGPVTIKVAAGEYQEDLPLTIPSNVSVIGDDMRNTIIVPDTSTQSSDVFLLNGESTVQNLTIKGFYSPGYAFKFAPSTVISSRSPYIQNVTVITQGTPITVTASSTFSVNSQETHPRGITFNNDGTKMFIVGEIGDDVNEYTLSTGFDLSSIVTFVDSFAVTQCPNPTAVKFNADGTKMFVTGTNNDNVHQYALTTGFDVSSASFTQTLVTTVDSDNFGLDFKPDGTKMYITGNQNNKIYEYNLSSAFDISSATFNQDLTLTAIDVEPFGIEWSTDGTRLFIVGTRGNGVDEFAVGTPYDISTLTHIGFYSIGGNPSGIHISPDGTKMFIIGNQSDTVKSYDLSVSYRIKVPTDDPRGFAQGDAGGGAYIDGASVNSASVEAAMLFHSVTFITPGVDGITMTNGVRVEWLNSFTYFANRGLYAVNGVTGHLSTDGSTIKYGAELRAIGSANVYGNFGAVADGADTLMYLIGHNMAYIGTGKFLDNDPSRVVQTQEITELNSGTIYYQTTDHFGNFRVGDQFLVNQETGETSIVITEGQVNALNGLTVTTNGSITLIDGEKVETGSLRFTNNTILSTLGDINIASAGGLINLNGTNIHKDLDISGDLSFSGDLNLLGNQSTDIIDFNVNFDQNINPNQDGTFNLGSAAKEWLFTNSNRANLGDIEFTENYITTTVSNADLELQANNTGEILIPNNNTRAGNNLTVSSNTDLQDISITGVLTHIGNRNQTGNYSTTNLTVQNLTVGSQTQFEEINIDGNVITTSTSNTNLELRANSTGTVLIPNQDVIVNNNFDIQGSTFTSDINVTQQVEASTFDNNTININANVITTDISNADLELRASGQLIIPSNDVQIDNNLTVGSNTDLQDISITGVLTHIGNRNQTGNYSTIDLTITSNLDVNSQTQFEEINIDGNVITTSTSNTNLELRANNLGNILIPNNDTSMSNDLTVGTLNAPTINIDNTFAIENLNSSSDIEIFDNVIRTTNSNSNLELRASGVGHVGLQDVHIKDNVIQTVSADITFNVTNNLTILGTPALNLPTGTILERSLNLGDIRFNTFDNVFEATSNDVISFGGVYSNDRRTSLTAHPTNNTISFKINNTQVGVVNSNGIELSSLQVDDVLINSNTITTNVSNSDLELEANGTGNTIIDDFEFSGGTITNTNSSNENFKFDGTGSHLVVFDNNYAVRFPSGTTAQRPAAPQLGLTRHNSDSDVLETYDGIQWIPSAGLSESISEAVMEDLSIQQSLIYG